MCSSIGSSREALLAKTSDWQTFMTLIVFENSRMKLFPSMIIAIIRCAIKELIPQGNLFCKSLVFVLRVLHGKLKKLAAVAVARIP